MAGQIRVEPAGLRAAAAHFPVAGDALAAALRGLQDALPDPAGMCGDDQAGTSFRQSYEPRVRQVEQALQALSAGLDSMGPGLRATAANIERADRSSVMRATGG